ncbi:unnamed protein product [Paramecium pentaurelia]|uniref:TLDc domain-containing protein n=1 Tax=Paramecium pentaurelia TaxID=43138 RepID=A0A8S1YAQ7_9CILI|nr:unnamed protein product [Paramecium pentaurelia]
MDQCKIHNCEITRIYLQLESQTVKLVCEECIEDQGLGTKLDKLVLLQKVKKQAEELISKTNIDNSIKSFLSKLLKATVDDIKITKRRWNDRLQNMKLMIDKLINETESYFDQLKLELDNFRKGLVNIVNFSKFESLIKDDQQFDKETQIINYIKELENEVNDQKKTEILNLIKDYKDKIANTQIPSISDRLNSITLEMNEYQKIVNDYSKQCNPDNSLNIPYPPFISKILSSQNLQKLLQRIPNQNNKIQQIYYAQQLGINVDTFWNSVNNKSNLLMIFRSKNKIIFGGYTPCQWRRLQIQMQQGINDETYTSFLFIQTGEELKFFPIKREIKPAIILSSQSGPNFGNDLIINSDLQSGQINLGNTYQSDILPVSQQQLILLLGGQNQLNINDCEIIQIVH